MEKTTYIIDYRIADETGRGYMPATNRKEAINMLAEYLGVKKRKLRIRTIQVMKNNIVKNR